VKCRARLNVCLDGQYKLLHRWLVVPVSDDVETLHHGNAGLKHGRQLSCEQRDVFRGDLPAALEELRFLAHSFGKHALASQVRLYGGFRDREHFALDLLAPLVGTFPDVRELLCRGNLRHVSLPEQYRSSDERGYSVVH